MYSAYVSTEADKYPQLFFGIRYFHTTSNAIVYEQFYIMHTITKIVQEYYYTRMIKN